MTSYEIDQAIVAGILGIRPEKVKKSQFQDKGDEWPTHPIIMAIQANTKLALRFQMAYMHLSMGIPKKKIAFHQWKLVRQTYTGVGNVRHWVWEDRVAGYRVYVSKRGIGFEVPTTFTATQAMRAWKTYRDRMLGIA